VQCFSVQVVIKQAFSQTPKKIFGIDSSCRFRSKRKNRLIATHSSSEKWRHRAKG